MKETRRKWLMLGPRPHRERIGRKEIKMDKELIPKHLDNHYLLKMGP
jgi:hypothetical protein